MIEIQELRAAGISIPPEREREIISRYGKPRGSSGENQSLDAPSQASEGRDLPVERRQRMRSLSQAEEEDDYSREVQMIYDDPRTPEEIAADPYEDYNPQPMYHQHRLRSSSSRIPLSTSSPMPVPQQHLERSTPLPRKRGASATWDEDGIVYNRVRSRRNSVGSQILLDEVESMPSGHGSPEQPSSPVKTKTPGRGEVRKPSGVTRPTSNTQKHPALSLSNRNSPAPRPSTSAGSSARSPAPLNRPEGDPPWLATMYKPDPRLPPDQQIIPTHAKRMMQERWEKEGTPGSTYDREFVPLSVNTKERPVSALSEKEGDEQSSWPLKANVPEPPVSPVTTEHGGYSTIPKMQSPTIGLSQSPRLQQQQQEFEESMRQEERKSKACGCCIVM